MRIRPRTPSVFGIYMVDVMCCALGCVILLWQVNRDESEARNAELQKAHVNISSLDQDKQGLLAQLKQSEDGRIKLEIELRGQLDRNEKLVIVNEKILALSKKLETELAGQVDKNEKLTVVSERDKEELKNLRKTHQEALAIVSGLRIEVKGLKDEVAGLQIIKTTLEGEKSKSAASLSARAEELAKLIKKLNDAEGKITFMSKEAADKSVELTDLDKQLRATKLSLESEKKALATFLKNLEAANLSVADLNKEKLQLLARIQIAETRFAGMTLTGRKVVFLVDMSGSMELVELNKADPDKWPLVCDTVARVMDSLSDLDSFQVILFSKSTSYPLGERGRFHKYRSKDQIKNMAAVLKTTKPEGGTNMYDAFNEAFKLRDQGLDTIYLFSDGLPNEGEGMPANALQLNEQQRTDALSRHIRNRLNTVWNRPNPDRVKINTIGFYFESAEVGAFLWALARENEGSFVGMNEAKKP